MKKGISLPINAIIIIVIGLIVFIALIAMFSGVFTPSSSTASLQAATKATCLKINPTLCNNGKYSAQQARMPVYDFDANKDGKINDFHVDAPWITDYCIDDNLETLCGVYYGCDLPGKTFSSVCDHGTDYGPFITNVDEEQEWYDCCVRKVCGCP